MSKRKDRPVLMRLLFSVSSLVFLGSLIYMFTAGINMYSGALLATAVLGLGVSSVISGDGFIEMITGFFEAFFEGLVDIVAGVFEAIGFFLIFKT